MHSLTVIARAFVGLLVTVCGACVNAAAAPDAAEAPAVFYTVTGEIALSRHEPRIAALEYAAAAQSGRDVGLLQRAAQVTAQCLQPSLTAEVAARWIEADPTSVEAHRAAATAAIDLYRIDQAVAHYRVVLAASPRGAEAEFSALAEDLAANDGVYAVRRVADRLAADFPGSAAALKLRAYADLRADDAAAAVESFRAALAALPATLPGDAGAEPNRLDLMQGLWRARVLSGDVEEPLAQAQASANTGDAISRLSYVLLLVAAQRTAAAQAELAVLSRDGAAAAMAWRLRGLLDFQDGRLAEAGTDFAALLATGQFLDDGMFYLGLIAERHEDFERALRFYAEVRRGENAVPALLHAAAILRGHGAAPAAEELLDRLIEEEPRLAPGIWASRARMYSQAGDGALAASTLDRALLQYPDSVELHYAVASLAEEQGKIAAALRELKWLTKQRPGDPVALNAYGFTLADHRQRLGAARKLVEQAYAAAPNNAAIADSVGWALFRQGHAAQALPYLQAAYAEDRGGDIAAHLGEVLWGLGNAAEAERVWSEGSRADADNSLVNATRVRLHAAR